MSHTPGPWTSQGVVIVAIDADRHIADACFGGVRVSSPDFTEAKDNARLIAAAPDLLEALRLALEYVDPEGPVDTEPARRVRATIEAAIEKAEASS